MICWFVVPVLATAQKIPNSGDQHTLNHCCALAAERAVHATPSGEVMTWDAVVVCETAQNNPSSGDQHTERHCTTVVPGALRAVHVDDVGS
jgi:hypothetical protein